MTWSGSLSNRSARGVAFVQDLCPHAAIVMPRDMAYPRTGGRAMRGLLDLYRAMSIRRD